jgi:predicted O-methyltransferase YrrM
VSVHRETFTAFVKEQEWTRGAELGVDKGILFGMLLRGCPALRLMGVDTFPNKERSKRVFELAQTYHERVGLLEMTTQAASRVVPDGEFDFVFIDADHSYEAVKDDIKCWKSKVRRGGWLGGHDYSRKFPGVIKAVNEAFTRDVYEWPGSIWGVWC